MRYFSCVAVAAGLLFCLTATPARADLAAPEAGSAETGEILSALQALTGLADAASELSPTSAYASAVKTTGPAGVALGGEGVDSSYGPVDTWSSYGSGFASTESNGAGGAALPASAIVHLDVREDIARGAEPFARIMAAVKALGPDEILVLRVPFEPVPLYGVLGRRGLAHRAEHLGPDDWSIRFYRERGEGAQGASPARPAAPIPASVLLLGGGLLGLYPLRRSTGCSVGA